MTGSQEPHDPPPDRPVPPAPPPPGPDGSPWRRLLRAGRVRATKANALATVLAVALGFGIVVQVRQTSSQGLETLREDELVRVLDTVDQEGARLGTEVRDLELSRDRLSAGTGDEAARKAAQERLDSLGILAGTVPATGPGIVLTIRDPKGEVTAPLLLDALQELRDAGAETVQINDVRVVASTYFTDVDGGIEISGRAVSSPYVVTAIGEGTTLASAMEIPGGVSESVRRVGGEVAVDIEKKVEVTALHTVSPPQYARPVPNPSPSP
ncbi:MAG TPA: DUF881 domain-containing protein [Dermatophilaceae bacterium]|nr:DUF881 domain-containing protein [Dermatophilaceae bacterium]